MNNYLAIAARALQSLGPSAADEKNETSPVGAPFAEPLFVNSVSFVGPFDVSSVAEPMAWGFDGENFDGISHHLLATLRARAATGDAQAAREAVELADYLASCDRGEVRWPLHALDKELANWNHRCSAAVAKKRSG